MTQRKYLVYEAFLPPYESPMFRAVEASGLHGLMVGVAPNSRVYSWWAEDGQAAIDMVEAWLRGRERDGV